MTTVADPTQIFLPDKVALNADGLYRMRTMTSLLAGIAAGVLGLTGTVGFLFFFLHAALVSAAVEKFACKGNSSAFFASGRQHLMSFSELATGLLTYILVWTLAYDTIYIF